MGNIELRGVPLTKKTEKKNGTSEKLRVNRLSFMQQNTRRMAALLTFKKKKYFRRCFDALKARTEQCITAGGKYFERGNT